MECFMGRAIMTITLLAVPLLSGCSTVGTYLFRPTNYTGLPQSTEQVGYTQVATLSLDASRRLMITPLKPGAITCSEPPPDATASLLAEAKLKGSATFPNSAKAEGELNDKFQTTLAMIANRTAAVEFWRTTSFAYCQLLMNGWTDDANRYLSTAQTIAPEFSKGSPAAPEPEAKPDPKVAGQ
jgi:hypothetical protein